MNILPIIVLIFVGQTLGALLGLLKRPKEAFLRASLGFAAAMMLGISFFQANKVKTHFFFARLFCFGA